jgi:serine/threonine protein kinase
MHRHPEGVFVHRDLKPENVLLSFDEAGRPSPVITDFGLAKNQMGRTRLTRYGIMMGSCGFSPWEQMRDAARANPAADTYSVGVVLYYMLTGLFPYEYPSPMEVLGRARKEGIALGGKASFQRIQNELTRERGFGMDFFDATLHCSLSDQYRPIPIRERSPRPIPLELADVVDRAIQKEIDKRYVDAVSMLEAVNATRIAR